jgi:hypothetical protein
VVVPFIGTEDQGMILGIEMFGFDGELFFFILEFEEEGNLMVSMRVTSIDKEPLGFVSINVNMILDILL